MMNETQTQTGQKFQKIEKNLRDEARGLVDQLRGVPSLVDRELKENPYRVLGIAGAIGFGLGAMFSSRILRMMLITAGGYGVNEILRTRISRLIEESALDKAAD